MLDYSSQAHKFTKNGSSILMYCIMFSCFMLAFLSKPLFADYQPLESVVAIVEDGVILRSELDSRIATIKNEIRKTGSAQPPKSVLEQQVLEQLILETIQLQLAERNGIRVSDSTLSDTMEKIAAQNNKTLPQFKQTIEDDGLVYKDIRQQIRKDLILSRLRQKMVANRITITEQDVKNYLDSSEGKEKLSSAFRLGHILLSSEETARKLISELDNANTDFFKTASKYGKATDLGLRKVEQLPTLFVDPVQDMSLGDVSEPISSPSGYHVIKVLEKQGGDHKIVKQTKVRHILIKPNEIRTRANAKQLIDDIRLQIINGKNFGEMARTYSEDAISASAGGDLGWAMEGDFVPEFENTMNATDIGEVSKPFYSTFGWHILEVMDRRQHNIGKEHQLDQARSILQQRQFEDEIKLWLREIRQDAFVKIKLEGYDESLNPDTRHSSNES